MELIENIIRNPDHRDEKSDHPRIIVSRDFDTRHIIRVFYKIEEGGIIKSITIYPAEKGRYY